jgi:hypothetical protein
MPWKEKDYFLSMAYIENGYRVFEQIRTEVEIADWRGEPGAFFMEFPFLTTVSSELGHIFRQND